MSFLEVLNEASGVAAADDRGGAGFGDLREGESDFFGAFRELWFLDFAEGAIPENGLGGFQNFDEFISLGGGDVEFQTFGVGRKIGGDEDFIRGWITICGDFATDEDLVGERGELRDQRLFVVNFGAAEHHDERVGRSFGDFGKFGDFLLEQEASNGRNFAGDGVGRGMGAMNNGKTVLDKQVGMGGF